MGSWQSREDVFVCALRALACVCLCLCVCADGSGICVCADGSGICMCVCTRVCVCADGSGTCVCVCTDSLGICVCVRTHVCADGSGICMCVCVCARVCVLMARAFVCICVLTARAFACVCVCMCVVGESSSCVCGWWGKRSAYKSNNTPCTVISEMEKGQKKRIETNHIPSKSGTTVVNISIQFNVF